MAGVGITIRVDDREFRQWADRTQRTLADLTPVMQEIGEAMRTSTIRRFETETGPDGRRWKKSRRARAEGGQTLTQTGRLRGTLLVRASRDQAAWGSNVEYAAAHQSGVFLLPRVITPRWAGALFWPGARHPVKRVLFPGAYIPARPFLGLDEDDRREIVEIFRRALQSRGTA